MPLPLLIGLGVAGAALFGAAGAGAGSSAGGAAISVAARKAAMTGLTTTGKVVAITGGAAAAGGAGYGGYKLVKHIKGRRTAKYWDKVSKADKKKANEIRENEAEAKGEEILEDAKNLIIEKLENLEPEVIAQAIEVITDEKRAGAFWSKFEKNKAQKEKAAA